MVPEKDDTSYIWDMLDAAKAVREFITGRSYQDYLIDRMLRGRYSLLRRTGNES
jgi:uncharacterized protein with HEPN domain